MATVAKLRGHARLEDGRLTRGQEFGFPDGTLIGLADLLTAVPPSIASTTAAPGTHIDRELIRVKPLLRIASYGLGASAAIATGLLILRGVVHEVESLLAEFHANRATYIYVFVASAALSMLLGYFLGRRVEEMRQQTMIDTLTGLYNRLGLNVRLHDEYQRAERFHAPLTLMLIDIDQLKQINDQYGHGVGDQILRGAAYAIRKTLRETDCGARWGGDEFAIVAPNTTELAAERLGERLLAEIPKWARSDHTVVTASVGVATAYPARDSGPTPEKLMIAADAALYQAKHGGRNQIRGA